MHRIRSLDGTLFNHTETTDTGMARILLTVNTWEIKLIEKKISNIISIIILAPFPRPHHRKHHHQLDPGFTPYPWHHSGEFQTLPPPEFRHRHRHRGHGCGCNETDHSTEGNDTTISPGKDTLPLGPEVDDMDVTTQIPNGPEPVPSKLTVK